MHGSEWHRWENTYQKEHWENSVEYGYLDDSDDDDDHGDFNVASNASHDKKKEKTLSRTSRKGTER